MDQARAPLMLFVTVADIRAAVPAALVRAVVRPLPTRRLGLAESWCPGATVFRGALVPVVDLGALLFGTSSEVRRLVILELQAATATRLEPRRLGLLVREVLSVGRLESAHELPSILNVSDALTRAALDETLTVALEPTRLLSDEQWSALASAEPA